MADETPIDAPEPAAAAAPEPPAAPAAEPSLLETFAADAPAAEAPVAEGTEPPAAPAEGEAKPEGDKTAEPAKEEPKAEGEKKEGEGEPAAEPPAPEPIVYEAFTLPEGVELVPEQLAAATEILAGARMPQEQAQKLVEMHTAALQDFAQKTYAAQVQTFNETRRGWANEVRGDPEMGGSGHDTAMRAIAGVRDRFVSPDDMKGFNDFLTITGAGDHPQFLRFIHKISKALAEPTMPPPNPAPTANPTTKDRRSTMYDHPRSA